MNEIHFIGVPYNGDGTRPQVEHPPQHLRDAGLLDQLAKSHAIRDRGDVAITVADGIRDTNTGVLNWPSLCKVTDQVSDQVHEALSLGGWPFVVGGDCSILLGIFAGLKRTYEGCGLFFVDGHGDFHTPVTSATGEAADMELAALTGRAPHPTSAGRGALLRDDEIVVLGVREYDGIDNSAIEVIDYSALCDGDLGQVVRVGARAANASLVWLHFDVDVIDPDLMPVIYPAGRGLTFEQTAKVLNTLMETGRVVGMDVTCFHPNLDVTGDATSGLVELLTTVLTK